MASIEDELVKADILLAEFEHEKARKKFNDIIKKEECVQIIRYCDPIALLR